MTSEIKQPGDGIENQEMFPLNVALKIRSNKGEKVIFTLTMSSGMIYQGSGPSRFVVIRKNQTRIINLNCGEGS